MKKILASILVLCMILSTMGTVVFADDSAVAKVGDVEYSTIDEAIANWTANTTLTLLEDITLNDVITLKSTEHHILDLGTYTLTAASGKNAIEITPEGAGTAAKSCLTINADAKNPGGITAKGKSCIYYTNTNKIADRLTVTINGGVFEGSYAINSASGPRNMFGVTTSPIRGQSAPYYVLNGGTFNSTVLINAGMLKVTGGTYNKAFTCNGDSTAYRLIYGGKFKNLPTLTHDAEGKLVFGTEKTFADEECKIPNGKYNAYIYIDDEGYYVVDTELPAAGFEATSKSAFSTMFKYSAIANDGVVGCTNAEVAMETLKDVKLLVPYVGDKTVKSGSTFTVDATENPFTGNVTITKTGVFVIKYNEGNPYTGNVENDTDMYGVNVTEAVENGIVTKTYTGYEIIDETNAKLRVEYDGNVEYFKYFQNAFESCNGTTGRTIVLMSNISSPFINPNSETTATEVTLDLNGYTVSNYLNGNKAKTPSTITVIDSSYNKTAKVSSTNLLSKLTALNYTCIVKGGTWTVDPSTYVADGYAAIERDGAYFVMKYAEEPLVELYAPSEAATFSARSSSWVLVGSYTSLEEALADSQQGYLIKLINDINVEDDVTINKAVAIDLNDYTVSTTENKKISIAEEVDLFGGIIDIDIAVESGHLDLENVEAHGGITVNNAGDMQVSSGWYKYLIADEYIAVGYDIVRTSDGYTIIPENEQADSISIEYEDVTDTDAEGEKTYEVIVKANGNDKINELASVDLTFVYTTDPVTGGAIDFTVAPAKDFTMSRQENTNRYMFNYNGVSAYEGIDNAITVGTITVKGYGKYTIATSAGVVNATTVNDNLVDTYTVEGATDNDNTTGGLDITGKVDGADAVIAVPTRELTVNIAFPNAVKGNAADYQKMKVEITGNIEGKTQTVTYDLGDENNVGKNASYEIKNDKLVLHNAYTVTVSGDGYRTARYTVTMTDDKTLNFWNNVMDNAMAIEKDATTGKVTKNFLAGDIVADNNINIYDLSAVVSYFTQSAKTNADYIKYDLNRDGIIDSKDVAYVLVSWGE